MQKCPRCELLLLDSDSECPRCHAGVEPLASPEQAAERRKSEERQFRVERARHNSQDGDYIPPLMPPLAMPTSAGLMALAILSPLFFSRYGAQPPLWGFGLALMIAIMASIVLNTAVVWMTLKLSEGKSPGLDRALFSAGLTVFLAAFPTFAVALIPIDFSATTYLFVWGVCIFIAVKAMFEMSFFQSLVVTGFFLAMQYGCIRICYVAFGYLIEQMQYESPF